MHCLTIALVLYSTLKKLKVFSRLLISLSLSGIIFLSLADRAYEKQGQKVVSMLFNYYHTNNQTVPKNLNNNITWEIISYTPLFDKYQYDCKYDSSRNFFFQLEYKDIWGKYYNYDNKDGDFRIGKTLNK
ncbi:hypothetical protein [Bernardetia sp. MNP-M8]|uniref:hypothetical protein n=1 Tax=Bernardetia sp. MNP-M8 TaxID=3127470 RepID=UPI0030CD203F